jgi:chemotaxis protein CheD
LSLDGGASRFEFDPAGALWTSSPLRVAKRVYLAPGQLFASSEPVQATTILGSCVAVCLWDLDAGIGGLNHFLLPEGAPPGPRFAAQAVPLLVSKVVQLGASPARLRAKLFGGACVLDAFRVSQALGARNVEAARQLLAAAQIHVVAEDVGGDLGRKLVFEVQTGSAWIRAIGVNS